MAQEEASKEDKNSVDIKHSSLSPGIKTRASRLSWLTSLRRLLLLATPNVSTYLLANVTSLFNILVVGARGGSVELAAVGLAVTAGESV